MKALPCIIALAGLAALGAKAQALPDPDTRPQLERDQVVKPDPFAGSHQPYPRVYGANVAERPNDKALDIVRDPRLVGGAEVTPNVAIEAGYARLPEGDRIAREPGKPDDASIPLGDKGASNHLALKYALPESERVSAYGKVGVAHDTIRLQGRPQSTSTSATRLYTGAGASVKVDRHTTFDAEAARHGNASKKLPLSPDGVKARLNMGF